MTTWMRFLPSIAKVGLVASALFGAYHHGASVSNETWQARWNARDTRDALTKAENEAAARAQEQAYQRFIEKATQDGQRTIDQAIADATTARAFADGVREAADDLSRRLAASEASGNSCTTTASKAAARATLVLADVLKRADQRAGHLAEIADQARARGLTCEQAYISLGAN